MDIGSDQIDYLMKTVLSWSILPACDVIYLDGVIRKVLTIKALCSITLYIE